MLLGIYSMIHDFVVSQSRKGFRSHIVYKIYNPTILRILILTTLVTRVDKVSDDFST